MNEIFLDNHEIFDFSDKEHLITYAEEGFSPLSFWLNNLGYKKEEIVDIADYVNETNTFHCLLPEFPVTIIPRRLVREDFNEVSFEGILKQVVLNCDKLYKEKFLLFDLGVPDVSDNVLYLIRRLLATKHKFANLKEYSIRKNRVSHLPQFLREVNEYSLLIHQIFYTKNLLKLKNNKWSPNSQKKDTRRHWYQLVDKVHAADLLQPRDIPTITRIFKFPNSTKREFAAQKYSFEKFSNFLAMMIVTNLISQIAHHSKFKLRRTFGKNILFPEIVGDCLSCCHLHLRPIEFVELILNNIKSECGQEIYLKLKCQINEKLPNFIVSCFVEIEAMLKKLVDEENLEDCSKKIQDQILNHELKLH